MSRLDRLVRSAGPHLDEDEVLVASVLGRRADGRGHVALVATDRRLLLLTEGFTRTMVEDLAYGDITSFGRHDDDGVAIEIVATEARWRLEAIEPEPAALVALQLVEQRCRRRGALDGPAGPAPDGGTPVPPRRVKVLPAPTP